MIQRLLIANRGEIAVRIARTAHRLGISTVGLYSDADARALHVDCVDSAVSLGGASPAESYLRADAVLAAAIDTGCDAIHPGYGFLAENAIFAQQVIDAGLIWVGPTPRQIALLGDKVAAKRAAVEAGVPTAGSVDAAPGNIPDGVAMPALVKAAAGGGGRGMRVVRSSEGLPDAVEAASREALSAFGDGTVFIEPYLERGRHVEVQIMGDSHGNVVHLGERECSIQRRNQKVLEESPSAGIDAATRSALCEGALALARHVGYENAGTVEFMVADDQDGRPVINFLEVNTRLQVEHPVTEAVTGLDLVELQLLVASGEPLPITQDDITISGHAIEIRVVAEDPANDWMPSTGTIGTFTLDPEDQLRVDTGFRSGATITPDYDSLLAKVISHGTSRAAAAQQLARGLRQSQITGIATNLDASVAMLGEADFLGARTTTRYLDEHPDVVDSRGPAGDDRLALLLAAVFAANTADRSNDHVTPFAPSGWRNVRTQGERTVWTTEADPETEHEVEVVVCGHDNARVLVGPTPTPDDEGVLSNDERRVVMVRMFERSFTRQELELDGRRYGVDVDIVEPGVPGAGYDISTRSPAGSLQWSSVPRFVDHEADVAGGGGPICPLPGTVIAVHVEAGQAVVEGTLLMVVEAMKMEHKIVATAEAVVGEVRFAVGDRVDQGDLLVSLDQPDPDQVEASGQDTP